MGHVVFGTKYTCEGCQERFYDLQKSPAVCPKCGVHQPPPKVKVYRPLRAPSDRGAFNNRRPLPAVAEEQPEAAEELVVEDADDPDDDNDLDDDTDVGIDLEIEPDDGKAAT